MFNSCFVLVSAVCYCFYFCCPFIIFINRKQLILKYLKVNKKLKHTDKCVFLHTYKKACVQFGWAFLILLFCGFSNFLFRYSILDILQNISSSRGFIYSSLDRFIDMFNSWCQLFVIVFISAVNYCLRKP